MRRVALAAMCAAVFVAGCSDNSRETPLGPSTGTEVLPPTANARCSPPPFPLVSITLQVGKVFPKGPLLVEALAREAIIVAFWGTCQPAKAQQAVASFVGFTLKNFQAKKIGAGTPSTSTPTAVSTLIDAMLVAVGLRPANLPLGPVTDGTDFGTGFADGTSTGTTTVKTNSGIAAGNFQGNAWGQPTVVTIFRLSDNPHLDTQNQANQFAPFFDINASNADNNHKVVNGQLFVGICLQSEVPYPEGADLEVGHNPVQTNGPTNSPSGLPVFEILNRLTQTQYNTLGLSCPLANPAPVQVGFKLGKALPTLASSALKMAGTYVGKFAEKLLPARAFAVVVSTSGVGGRTSSYSPFGVVEPDSPIQYGATGFRYLVVSEGSPPAGFQNQAFDDSGWATGNAGFGFNGSDNCSLIGSDTRTAWPANTQLLLRRQFTVPGGGSTADISVAIDNDIKVFVNGTDITSTGALVDETGFARHEGCPTPGSLTFTASNLQPGINFLAIQARDRGGSTFVDVSVDPPPSD